MFFSADSLSHALGHIKVLVKTFWNWNWNPWTLFDGTITKLGVTYGDVNIIMVGVLALVIVAILREKHGFARTWMQRQILPFRWLVWLLLFVITLIWGMYGPGYDAAAFIYEGF